MAVLPARVFPEGVLESILSHAQPRAVDGTDLRRRREALVARLEDLAPGDFDRTAMHPRLRQPMRVVDMMLFHAEHDDAHFARIRVLMGLFA